MQSIPKNFLVLSIFILIFPAVANARHEKAKAPHPIMSGPEIQDVSDRSYLAVLRDMINAATATIDIGLSKISVTSEDRDPVNLILEDLVNAAKRGVRVRLFLNTFSSPSLDQSLFLREDKLNYLKRQGVETHFVSPRQSFGDQLVITDQRILLEGGMPWTEQELETGLASASLIRSEEMGIKKVMRLELLPLWDLKTERDETTSGAVPIPVFLLQDVQYFPQMVKHEDGDAMRIYLALLEAYYRDQSVDLKVKVEDYISKIPAERTLEKSGVSHEIRRALDRLEESYDLITLLGQEPEAIHLRMKLPATPGAYVDVPQRFFEENYGKDLSASALYVYFLIRERSQISGHSPVWVGSERNLEQDFPIRREDFHIGVDELRRENLIEIYPFPLRQGNSSSGPGEPEIRYLINDIPSLSERLEIWSRMRQEFGDEEFLKAQELAELFGEPKDSKVIATYTQLLLKYPANDVRALTEHLASLPPQSTPERLEYLELVLRNETQGTHGLSA